MSSERVWGAMASLEGSIQGLGEQVALQRTRADEAEAREAVLQGMLAKITSNAQYVFVNEAMKCNHLLTSFASRICEIAHGEE